ncbi:MAG: methyltransferase domain-containing protein [Anaerolineae bacterium]|nr:methyltransferase domain-containing protein [Thermoflexales bacterium]MDW8406248.1 methyltransferase domain-containing protein [Anaerolineae bacterium]
MNSADVRAYYERNTRLFLALGAGRRARTIHRAVWASGIVSADEALHYTSRLLLHEIECLRHDRLAAPVHIIDLGCGVGGTLFYLASHFDGPLSAVGVTISPLQVRLAREQAARLGLQDRFQFIEADFLCLPDLTPADIVFSIEAFVHAPAPERYMAQAARVVRAGGRLIVCDDFLSPRAANGALTAQEQRWLRTFQEGWHAPGLSSAAQITELAGAHGFKLLDDRDLTPDLRVLSWNMGVIDALIRLGRLTWLPSAYWRSTLGSLALQQCLKAGLTTYRFLVFARCD